jgi:hypothetical protein
MDVGKRLLDLARAAGAQSLAVVGTSKNAGKTVALAAVCDALQRAGTSFGLCSIGRDGESADALDAVAKPRYFLRPGAVAATASTLVPAHPACELLECSAERSALGPIVLVRARAAGYLEVAGPPAAAALRRIARALATRTGFVLIDGAVDRIAALRDGDDAIVVAVGTAAPTPAHAVDDVRALVARLRLPEVDPTREALRIDGALSAAQAADLVRAGERRQIVVADPTRIAFGGRPFSALAAKLDLRVARCLRPIACTVAPRGAERAFEPRAFLEAVARATGLPAFDVYAGAEAA